MKSLKIPQMIDVLTQLGEAEYAKAEAERLLGEAARPYETARDELLKKVTDLQDEMEQMRTAMAEDPTIAPVVEGVRQATIKYDEALEQAKLGAMRAWREQATEDTKQWMQSGFEIRLQESRKPDVTDPMAMLGHLVEIEAMAIVKQVNVKLDNKRAIALRESIKVPGLEIDVRLGCSIKKFVIPGGRE